MVVSKINPEVNFIELSKIYEEDKRKELDIYQMELLNEDILISIGGIQNTNIKK